MTNEQIILHARLQLLEEGKISRTGQYIDLVQEDGSIKRIPEPEEIHSFTHWKECGYSVKKGEKAIAKIWIWKHVKKKDKDENEQEHMFRKLTYFFARSQVEKYERKEI